MEVNKVGLCDQYRPQAYFGIQEPKSSNASMFVFSKIDITVCKNMSSFSVDVMEISAFVTMIF